MSPKTVVAEKTDRRTFWLKITVIWLAEGNLARLGFYWAMLLRDGTR
jgi:hypothetical protein